MRDTTTYYVTRWRKRAGYYPEYRTRSLTPVHAMLRERDGFPTIREESHATRWAFGSLVVHAEEIPASPEATARRKAMILADREERKAARSRRLA